jgi:hypothetical protein
MFGIPLRRLTADERVDQLLLAAAEEDYLKTGDLTRLQEIRKSLATPAATAPQSSSPKDPLDAVRVVATLIMVTALFIIVYLVALKPSNSAAAGSTQLVSLASGLAGIGLGWLFGTGAPRGKR